VVIIITTTTIIIIIIVHVVSATSAHDRDTSDGMVESLSENARQDGVAPALNGRNARV
jgi:hypothetical protein